MTIGPFRKSTAFALLALFTQAVSAAPAQPARDVEASDFRIGSKPGNPTFDLPSNMRLVSAFGERPVFSPDGTHIAFIGESYGDAYEMDLKTGVVRNLTAHAPNKGFLRIHYLPNGNYILLGPRVPGSDREATRVGHIEMFWLDAKAERAPVPLNHTVFEGIAVSSAGNLLAWAETGSPAKKFTEVATTKVYTATLEDGDGHPRLANVREVYDSLAKRCHVEAQDFLPGNTGLTMPCYYIDQTKSGRQTDVIAIDFASGKLTTYPTPPQLFGEVEGIFPDGKSTLVECGGGGGLDVCQLELKADKPRYTRLTRIMDYGRWLFANPSVSPDGKTIAMQIGSADVIDAGVGQGIVLMTIK